MAKMIISACGEHYVASYLSGMGLVVALTKSGTPTTDLFATLETGGRSISVQVKTGGPPSYTHKKKNPEKSQWTWRVGRDKAIASSGPLHWYVFVYLGDWPKSGDSPQVFFVPSKFVVDTLKANPLGQEDWFWMLEEEVIRKGFRGLDGYHKLEHAIVGKRPKPIEP